MYMTNTLWSDVTRARHFLIPDSVKAPSGDFVLRTVVGRQMEVDEKAVLQYEVSREEAEAWLKAQFGQLLDGAKESVKELWQRLRKTLLEPKEAEQPSAQNSAEGMEELASYLEEAARTAGDHLRTFAERLRQRARDAESGPPP